MRFFHLHRFRIVLITLLVGLFGIGKFLSQQTKTDHLSAFLGKKTTFVGQVDSFPDKRAKNTRVFIRTEHGRFLLIDTGKNDFFYNDRIEISGTLTRPRSFQGFDYAAYLRRFQVYSIMKNSEEIIFLEPGRGWLHLAQKLREKLAKNLEKTLPAPHRTIAMGILLGVKNELPSETKKQFQASGLQHLLVVSGFNVSVILFITMLSLKRFGRRMALTGSLFVLIFFVGMTGAEPPVIRAALMGGLVGWGKVIGRKADILNILLFSAVIMGLANPQTISSDIGFHLSFFATLGIILFAERIKLWPILSVSLAAQLSVAPLLIFYFGSFPLVGIVANVFAEPLIPLTMAASSIPAFTGILGLPAEILLEVLLQIAAFFSP